MFNVGIIGCGGISASHYEGFRETGRAAVTCVYDVDVAAAREKAAAWNAHVMPSAEDVIENVDVVVIATPGFAHREYVEAAAAAGKHILCEKPIALNIDDATAVKKAVDDGGVTFMCAFNHRHHPPMVQLHTVQESGRIGGTVCAWARLHAPASTERWLHIQKTGHWRSSMERSGGRINEFCSHAVNWLLWVLGSPKSVYGKALCVTEGFELDDADLAIIDCEHGVGLLDVHRHAAVAPDENYGIQGHAGSVVLKNHEIHLTPMDADTEQIPIDDWIPGRHEDFLRCIETGARPVNDVDAAIDTLNVCLAFNRSAESARVEQV